MEPVLAILTVLAGPEAATGVSGERPPGCQCRKPQKGTEACVEQAFQAERCGRHEAIGRGGGDVGVEMAQQNERAGPGRRLSEHRHSGAETGFVGEGGGHDLGLGLDHRVGVVGEAANIGLQAQTLVPCGLGDAGGVDPGLVEPSAETLHILVEESRKLGRGETAQRGGQALWKSTKCDHDRGFTGGGAPGRESSG